MKKGDPRGSFFVGIKIKEMSVFKKKTDIFTPENKKIRIEKTKNTQMPHTKKPSPDTGSKREQKR